ncbi:uncharacterized protein SMIM47 isoform X2 [Chlorocebus sabaeus]|uniref:uncharacterized protein SMIM47 isoform X2 n=1 Tax=Chlorocebus sabaeus TaxID=60711 RepID=UPI003BFA2F61
MKWGFPNRRVYWTPLEESRLAPRPGLESGAHYKLARAATRVRFVERNFASSLGLPAIPIQVLKGLTIPWCTAGRLPCASSLKNCCCWAT